MNSVASRAYMPTPLHARTAELCATNQWIQECGFTLAALYTSPHEEQDAILSRVALCDLSARQLLNVQGQDAASFLSAATVSDASAMEVGQIARTVWCDDHGFVRGEGSITRLAKAEFELSTSVRDFAWFADAAKGFAVQLANATGSRAMIGLRGPLSSSLLAAVGLSGHLPKAGRAERPDWKPAQIAVASTEIGDGANISMPADDGVVVWERLWRAGTNLGIAAVGAQVLELARIEQGLARAGVDWVPAQVARTHDDIRVPSDLGFTPDLSRNFNGAPSLRASKAPRPTVFAQFASDDPLAPGAVTLRGVFAGRITSQAWFHSRAGSVALGWLDVDALKIGTKVVAAGPIGPVRAEIIRSVFA